MKAFYTAIFYSNEFKRLALFSISESKSVIQRRIKTELKEGNFLILNTYLADNATEVHERFNAHSDMAISSFRMELNQLQNNHLNPLKGAKNEIRY